jgi:hypothetical protein
MSRRRRWVRRLLSVEVRERHPHHSDDQLHDCNKYYIIKDAD